MSIVKNYYGNDITKIKIEIETNDIQEAINFLKKYEEEKKRKNNNFLFFLFYSIAQTIDWQGFFFLFKLASRT